VSGNRPPDSASSGRGNTPGAPEPTCIPPGSGPSSQEPSEKIGVAAQLQSPKGTQREIVQACSMTPPVPKDGANATG